jgi:hypothetical protein
MGLFQHTTKNHLVMHLEIFKAGFLVTHFPLIRILSKSYLTKPAPPPPPYLPHRGGGEAEPMRHDTRSRRKYVVPASNIGG